MNIGIDIDDTITDTFDYLMESISEYFGIDINYLRENNISYSNLPEEYNKHLLQYGLDTFAGLLKKVPLKNGAVEFIKKLKEDGNNIIIITARDNRIYETPYESTKDQLDVYNIVYDKLVCTFDKADACKDNNIDLFIDDSINNIKKVTNLGIDTIIFDSKVNKETDLKCKRVYNWNELYDYISQKY